MPAVRSVLVSGVVVLLVAAPAAAQRITNAVPDPGGVPPALTVYGVGFGATAGEVTLAVKGRPVPLTILSWTSEILRVELPAVVPGTHLLVVRPPGKPPAFFAVTLGAQVAVANYAPSAETGQTDCWDVAGQLIPCGGSGQDGELRLGVKWPVPRLVDRGDGTVLDRLTGIIWLRDWMCLGKVNWDIALQAVAALADGRCGLTGGYREGDFAVPNVGQMQSLVHYGTSDGLPPDHPFNFDPGDLWTSTSFFPHPTLAWSFSATTPVPAFIVAKIKAQGNLVPAVYRRVP